MFGKKSKKENALLSESKPEDLRRQTRTLAVLESMVEGVMVVDTDQRVLLINSQMSRMLGLKKEGLERRYFWEVFRDSEINQMIEKSLSERAGSAKEHSLLLSDLVFQIQISPVFGGDEFLGVAVVFHDVTKLKELERMRSEFVANVSHELKTPLTSILGFVETLKEGAVEDPANRMKFLDIIGEHSRKLQTLIEDLLVLSRFESSQEPLKKERLNLGPMVEKLLKFYERPLGTKRLKVTIGFSPSPFWVEVEPKSFEQALSNLFDNAIKYNRENGEILVKAHETGAQSVIAIHDSGIGVPEIDLQRIFERFYRVDKSRSRETGGTGLGLSIVKHIVERHGGAVKAESPPGRGAIFTITLPKAT